MQIQHLLAVGLAATTLCCPLAGFCADSASDFQGYVRKDTASGRISRPGMAAPAAQTPTATPPPGGVADQSFNLNSAFPTNSGPDDLDKLFPQTPTSQLSGGTAASSAPGAATGTGRAAVGVDYAAIEKAYQDLTPPQPVAAPAVSAGQNSDGAPVSQMFPVPVLIPTGAAPNNLANTYNPIDVDNCACGAPVPTTQCMQSRSTTMGVHAASPASSGMLMQPPTFSRLNVPGVPAPQGMAFTSHH